MFSIRKMIFAAAAATNFTLDLRELEIPLVRKSLLSTITLALLCFASSSTVLGDTITVTLPPQTIIVPPTQSYTAPVGTFTFTIPVGQQITGASLSGNISVSLPGDSGGGFVYLFLDGQNIGVFSNNTLNSPFGISLPPSLFPSLAGGSVVFSVTAYSGSTTIFPQQFYNGGTVGFVVGNTGFPTFTPTYTTLNIQTAPSSPITSAPESATMLLLGTGLVGVVAKVRHRRKAQTR